MDRGRLVREAIAILLADLDARGKDSLVARRIRTTLDGQPVNGQLVNGTAPSDDPDDTSSPLPSLAWRRMRAAR